MNGIYDQAFSRIIQKTPGKSLGVSLAIEVFCCQKIASPFGVRLAPELRPASSERRRSDKYPVKS
jgi:hypothetical protein